MKIVRVYKESKLVATLEGFGNNVDVIEQIERRDGMEVECELIKRDTTHGIVDGMYYRGDTVFIVTEYDYK